MKTLMNKFKGMDYQQAIISASVVFSATTALLGYVELSVGYSLSVSMLFVLGAILKDLKELSEGLND